MKKKICKLLSFTIIAIIVLSCQIKAEEQIDRYNILVINSYHYGHKWEENINEGIMEAISEINDKKITIKNEYLDFRHNSQDEYIKQFINMIETKYPKGTIDGIYTIDNEAFITIKDRILDERSSLYQVPLLFSGVNGSIELSNDERKYISGIYERDDTVQLLNLIHDMNPQLQTLTVILEDSGYGKSIEDEINEQIDQHWNGNFKVNFIKSNYIDDIEDGLRNIEFKDNGVIIVAGEYQYKENLFYLQATETINVIKKYSDNAIYSNDYTYIDAGILGGCIDIGKEHGNNITKLFNDIFNGKDILSLDTILEPNANKFINYDGIYEFNINPWNVPIYSIVRNKKIYNLLLPPGMRKILRISIVLVLIIVFIHIYKETKDRKLRLKKQELEKIKNDYIVSISHELRTPLNLIINTSKVLSLKVQSQDIDYDYFGDKLKTIDKNSHRLIKLVNNLIYITKSEMGFSQLTFIDYDIVELVIGICESVAEYCNKKNINLTFESDVENIIIAMDKEKIKIAIVNIIANAIKFTHCNGNIDINIKQYGDNVIITINDTGIGMNKEQVEMAFTKHYQADDILTRSTEGSGMGLTISKDIILRHNGQVVIDSNVGVGTTVKIILPIVISNNVEDENKVLNPSEDVKIILSDID